LIYSGIAKVEEELLPMWGGKNPCEKLKSGITKFLFRDYRL
jgi:hypothetical protein